MWYLLFALRSLHRFSLCMYVCTWVCVCMFSNYYFKLLVSNLIATPFLSLSCWCWNCKCWSIPSSQTELEKKQADFHFCFFYSFVIINEFLFPSWLLFVLLNPGCAFFSIWTAAPWMRKGSINCWLIGLTSTTNRQVCPFLSLCKT